MIMHFQFGKDIARVLALAPGHPVLSALRRLHEPAFAQLNFGAADHKLLDEGGITEPEDGAEIVILGHAVQHDCDRSAWPGKKLVTRSFGAAQLRRCQRPAHFRASA
jgi:hypothetical protein